MISARFEGGAELAATLAKMPARVSTRVQIEALTDAAEPMRERMETLAAHEPGQPDLRDTMVISKVRGVDEREAAVAVGPSRAGFYGSFLEFGTRFTRAQPFVRPAFDENTAESLRILSAALWTAMAGRGFARVVATPTAVQSGGGSGLL